MKKVVSLLLVAAMAVGMSTVAFAAGKVTGVVTGGLKDVQGTTARTSVDTGDLYAQGSPEFYIPLNVSAFTVDGSNPAVGTNGQLTKSEVSSSKLTVKLKASKGSQVIDEYKLDYVNGAGRIKLVFIDPFKSNNTDGVDFDFKVYVVIDGKNWSADEYSVSYTGTYMNNYDDDYDKDTDYYDFSDGKILKPADYIKSFEGDMGEGVSVFMRGLKNQKYWGVANVDTTDADDANIVKYGLDQVYHLDNVGIASVADYVMLNDADTKAYVYDGDMKYLGRGNEKLPFSETYYLAAKELDVDSTDAEPVEESTDDGDDYVVPGATGGDNEYPTNVNDNPGTGR